MEESRTYIATPPGATIKEQITDRGMSQKELAQRTGISEKHISHLINGEVQLTPAMANKLEMVLGIPASFWNNLEAIYREKLAKVEEENALDEDIELSRKFPYNKMAKLGWVPNTRNKTDRAINLRAFFEVAKLEIVENIPGIAFRQQTPTGETEYALMAWAQKAKLEARKRVVSPINLRQLEDYLPSIRNMAMQLPEEFVQSLIDKMAECGIAMVFLPHLSSSFLHGASFYDNKKIVIGLTVRGKDADKFWFSLFHELGHVLLGHINLANITEEEEREADQFAQDTLIPPDKLKAFTSAHFFTNRSITDFARQIYTDPGIVVGRLQKEGYVPFNRFNNMKKKYELE